MKQIVLGTAGHIDHGKTSLIKALTNIDTDRLKEEKERGITIDLGFAFLSLGEDIQLGIVDVPGHERFVKNMLAGVGGIDLVMLVIAADEGVMPQTREHLAICELLQVREGLVALTKTDMVEPDWLDLVQEDTAEFLHGTFLEGKPIVPVSSKTGAGLPALVETLHGICTRLTPKSASGSTRLPIDRVFSMRGFGTVVTGTLFSGTLHLEDRVEIQPRGITARVRGLQVHNLSVSEAVAGQRTAVNLQGLEKADIQRGDVLITPGRYPATYMLDVTLAVLKDAPRPLKHRAQVRFHIGTSEIMGRVILLDRDEVQPGTEVFAQLRLAEPTVAAPQDRYVLRSYSPVLTIAGGTILDTLPAKHRRHRPEVVEHLSVLRDGTAVQNLTAHLYQADYAGLKWADFLQRSPLDDAALHTAVSTLQQQGVGVLIEDNPPWLVHRQQYERVRTAVVRLLEEFHQHYPLRPAMVTEELRSKFPGMEEKVFATLLQDLAASGHLEVSRDKVKLAQHTVTLSPERQAIVDRIEQTFHQAQYQPPSVEEAFAGQSNTSDDARALLQVLVDQQKLVRLKGDIFYHRTVLDDIEAQLRTYIEEKGEITAGEFRDLLHISRKYAIPLLEHFDNQRLTVRLGDKRVLRKTA
jgi:selenocysteine-specific elongation factor